MPSRTPARRFIWRRPLSAPRLAAISLGLALIATLAILGFLDRGSSRPSLSVLLVTLDTLRADRLGCYGRSDAGTPRLDALAARGLRFDRAYTVAPVTLPSHTSILTGTYPLYHGVRDNGTFRAAGELETLAEMMAVSGRRTAAFVSAFPLKRDFGLAQGFEVYDDRLDDDPDSPASGTERRGDRVVAAAGEWMGQLAADQPFFAWVHLYDPHAPYTPPERYAGRYPDDPYQGEVAFTDDCVGRLFDALAEAGRLESTLVVVVADHGESLGEHGERSHGLLIHDGTMRVPWIMAGPAVPTGAVRSDVVRTVDLVPTLAEHLGLPIPRDVQGAPLDLDRSTGEASRTAYLETQYPKLHYGWSELRGLVQEDWKIIEAPEVPESTPELYRLDEDPGETNDLAAAQSSRLTDLRERLSDQFERLSSRGTLSTSREMTEAERQRLAQLGYAGSPSENRSGRHPRDMIALKYLLDDAKRAVESGRAQEARRILEEVSARDPENPGIPEIEGVLFKKSAARDADARRRAIEAFERAVELSPENNRLWKHLADLHAWDGDLGRAIVCLQEALRRGPLPLPAKARRTYAEWLERTGRFAEAQRVLTALPSLQPASGEEAVEAGHRALEAGRRVEALCLFDRAAEVLLGESEELRRVALKRAAEIALQLDLAEQARARLDALLELDPDDAWAQRQRDRLR